MQERHRPRGEIAGQEFTAKDFRTWSGTVLAAQALQEISAFDSDAQARKNIVAAVERVAKRLGNTRTVCRKCYIHPAVIALIDSQIKWRAELKLPRASKWLTREERGLIKLLEKGPKAAKLLKQA